MKEQRLGPTYFWAITVAYSAVAFVIIIYYRHRIFPISAPDAGSLLAGIFSPLAFLWLVYTAMAQRAELELQRKELADNNLSQKEQAEALRAQVRALNGQADAAYEPVLYLQTSEGVPITDLHAKAILHVVNYGQTILDVKNAQAIGGVHFDMVLYPHSNQSIFDNVIPYWPSAATVKLRLLDSSNEFKFLATRRDAARVIYTYRYLPSAQRLELINREIVI